MRKIIYVILTLTVAAIIDLGLSSNVKSEPPQPEEIFESAVRLIKKYETLHQPRHYPLVGYGHKVLPGEKFSRTEAMDERKADSLLRVDLLKNCAMFRQFGKDSLLLGTLAYNVGSGTVLKSSIVKKLSRGDRDIRQTYLSYCKYRGKRHAQIAQRRKEEFDLLFIENTTTK